MQTIKRRGTRPWTITQWVVLGISLLILTFIVIGSVFDVIVPDPEFSVAPKQPFVMLALLAFVGGILSFLAPCTLPILPAYFAFASQSNRRQIATNTLVFMLGVATMFSLFGATASVLGRVLRQSQDLILLLGGSLVIVFGVLSLLGKGFAGVTRNNEQVQSQGLGGAYVFGLTFAAGWSTCIGPILGIVLTMAATTGSALSGSMLLFIYTLGIGLPLILVSTFLGRTSRQNIIWRFLRGKGWLVNVPSLAVVLIWAAAIWLIVTAAVEYAFLNFSFLEGQAFTHVHEYGLLILVLLGAGLWAFTSNDAKKTELHLHSTQLISGVLFLAMGLLMLNGALARITSYFAGQGLMPGLYELEETLFSVFQ